jgi:hypothetical protein
VGRLKGTMVRATGRLQSEKVVDAHTIVGDKMPLSRCLSRKTNLDTYHDRDEWPIEDTYHEIVLRSSAQCLPMVKFDRALQHHKEGRQCVQYLQYSLQQIIDRLFNNGMVSSDIRDAPLISAPESAVRTTVRAALSSAGAARASSTALSIDQLPGHLGTLSSASWVPPRASSMAFSSNQLPGQY